MSTNQAHNAVENPAAAESDTPNGGLTNGSKTHDFEKATRGMSHEEKQIAARAARFGYGPLAHMRTNEDSVLPGMSECLHVVSNYSRLIKCSLRW
jgi:hypothetical protein